MSWITKLGRIAGVFPSAPSSLPPVRRGNGETLLAIIDRSGSMEAPCGATTRLGAAKEATIAMLKARLEMGSEDVVGIIAFNDAAAWVHPLAPLRMQFDRVCRTTDGITIGGGTDLDAPLRLAGDTLSEVCDASTHIVMLTDGQGGNPRATAQTLKRHGVVLETIGVGARRTDVDELLLREIASVVNGKVLYRFIHDRAELRNYFMTDVAGRLVK